MIAGVVTTKDVLLHSPTIVHDFGLRAWLNCCKALRTNRRTTFLELDGLGCPHLERRRSRQTLL